MSTGIFINESDFRSLFDNVADYVIAINRNHQIIMSNDLFKKRFGAGPGSKCYKAWKNVNEKCITARWKDPSRMGWCIHTREPPSVMTEN